MIRNIISNKQIPFVSDKHEQTLSVISERYEAPTASEFEDVSIDKPTPATFEDISISIGEPNLDMYAIKKSITGTRTTEIHVLSKASNYQAFSLHTGTTLHETNDNWEFV